MANEVSILIIGSLIWNTAEHRESWRTTRLVTTESKPVWAPIRYGRLSGTNTSQSYTMVFSNELAPNRRGRAVAVPCRCRVNTANQLFEEAQALWAAEQRKASAAGPLADQWGAVGLLCNPHRAGFESLQAEWSKRIAEEHEIYRNFAHADGEVAAIGPDGLLTIGWPTTESGEPLAVDILLATATKPEPLIGGRYATPQEIAAAWKMNPDRREYFDKNREHRITTAFDDQILQALDAR